MPPWTFQISTARSSRTRISSPCCRMPRQPHLADWNICIISAPTQPPSRHTSPTAPSSSSQQRWWVAMPNTPPSTSHLPSSRSETRCCHTLTSRPGSAFRRSSSTRNSPTALRYSSSPTPSGARNSSTARASMRWLLNTPVTQPSSEARTSTTASQRSASSRQTQDR